MAVDFDGVLHEYTGWDGNPPKGKPIEGCGRALAAIRDAGFAVIVFSARETWAVEKWLQRHGLAHLVDSVTDVKPKSALAFFDDRGVYVPGNTRYGLYEAFKRWSSSTRNPTLSTVHRTSQEVLPGSER